MESKDSVDSIADRIRDVPDFPKKGILFKDITPVLSDIDTLRASVKEMAAPFMDLEIDVVVGIESRGFIFGAPIADVLNCSFVPVRKPGKLPWKTESVSYELEYGTDALEIHEDAITEGQNVLIVDDLLATGGTAEATCKLVSKLGGNIKGLSLLIELEGLNGRKRLNQYNVHSLVQY
ncbi:MAG: adenine phosphoribosyltransferase [Candidatus Poseidoniia archaeon]|jgi:adenine phosphoribosyltransferase|nr:adenine phosphoribosyltransferase [Candidatus Poseidoniia archaeon]MDP6592055.1 adenine phosphoribosyltransferase [Candidatus Poseidoniia archaeon]MDP7096249.1 adenine phosphoribosyltransferase [Candidatus Poseidoniia archaeon]MDP7187972.1 adenine phosphoribosyltransferase [Candidatus Poseidoniia archaeon]MDP7444618.1 adenine phosphoribosyltransferase [Candidatus Poseidoniia archaeon]|tara:strand:- start:6149 stop:6682 length:534 start_codon:yes stop_codon:yes gene_type:complete